MAQQCKGLTKKGTRCKIMVSGDWCHHHMPDKRTGGFIYIYTLTSLLQNQPIKVKNLPQARSQEWVSFEPGKSKYYLLKIGMTTSTIERRLSQWENQCGHSVTVVYPGGKHVIDRLLRRFSSLSLENNTFASPHTDSWKSFQKNGFYAQSSAAQVEKAVHRTLRGMFGDGSLYCTGCPPKKHDSGTPFPEYSIHTEWFLVPKKDLGRVYEVIDRECRKVHESSEAK